MDFTLGEELEAVRDLARKVFAGHTRPERLDAVDASADRIDADLWADLGRTGLLGVALPVRHGGAGLGPAGLCVLLEEQGRRVAPAPVWPAVVGALAVAGHGDEEQRRGLLPALADGSSRLTVALEEFGPDDPGSPACRAERDGGRWRLTGTKAVVPAPSGAGHVLVSARTDAGPGLFLVASGAEGAAWERAETTTRDLAGTLVLAGAPAAAVGVPGGEALARALDVASVALAALQLGVAEGALDHAVAHVRERVQFGRPLGAFQAVRHQVADCYIEIEALRACLWQAVCALEEGDADAAVLVARWWADEAGPGVVHRVQHLHGGSGVDVSHPVHRHLLWGRQIAGTLGGAAAGLDRLGAVLAARARTAHGGSGPRGERP
ncbi:acyl-CoA dehydrogenase family protein [Microbispora corallina]